VILWINVENKYPIAKDEKTNQLYAVLPQMSILPSNGSHPFSNVRNVKHNDYYTVQLHNSIAKLHSHCLYAIGHSL